METTLELLEDLEDDLSSRAYLYENPSAYREGVEAALAAIRAVLPRLRVS